MTPFAAVLLAGGRSRRMGRDKALLPLRDGRQLWERQLGVLRQLAPSALFVSGPPRNEFPPELTCLEDQTPGQGPLSGIATTLQAMAPLLLLVVLAVDLPAMTPDYLQRLLRAASQDWGVVPRDETSGLYEPLAAVYPAACLQKAQLHLREGNFSMQRFIHSCGPLIQPRKIASQEAALFNNWNSPDDLAN